MSHDKDLVGSKQASASISTDSVLASTFWLRRQRERRRRGRGQRMGSLHDEEGMIRVAAIENRKVCFESELDSVL